MWKNKHLFYDSSNYVFDNCDSEFDERFDVTILVNGLLFTRIELKKNGIYVDKVLDIKRLFRDKMQKNNNIVINIIFSTLTCRVLI